LTKEVVVQSKLRGVLGKALVLFHEKLVESRQLCVNTDQPGGFLSLLLPASVWKEIVTHELILIYLRKSEKGDVESRSPFKETSMYHCIPTKSSAHSS
jgi:hypothetical protein